MIQMPAKCKFFYLSFFLYSTGLFAQNLNNTTNNALSFPSPNNSFLGKTYAASSVSVDYYTGTAQIHVPVCALASKELSIPISLDYVDGRGVKLQEYASQMGLGWQLNAGGSISRVVRGFPDEQANGYLGTGQWGQVVTNGSTHPDYNSFFTTISQSNTYMLTGLNEPNDEPLADGEPDLFYVKTPFFSFQFVFDQNGHPVFSNYNGFKIISSNFFNTLNYQNSSFEVVDDLGNQFYFGNTANSIEQSVDSIFGQVPPPFTVSWYLTRIVSYNGKDVVTFNYQAAASNDITYHYSWMETESFATSTPVTHTYLSTGKTTVFNPKFISSIVSGLGELDFTYNNSRLDDPNVPSLASIVVKALNPSTSANSITLQTYNFNYDYFNSSSSDPNLLRLKLNNVTVTGNTSGTSTPVTIASFGYNTSASLPDRTLPVFDYWGYCTTIPSPIPADIFNISRTPDVIMAQAGILNSITTLLGGTWNIVYELNAYNPASGSTNVGGLRVNKITQTLPSGESIGKTYQYADASGNSYGQIYSSNYNSLYVSTASNFMVYFSNSPYTVNDVNGVFVGYSYVKETDPNGGWSMYNFSNFSDFNDLYHVSGNSLSVLHTPTTSFSYKRGLLMDKKDYSSNGNIVSEVKYNYSAVSSPVTNSGYGLRVVALPTGAGPWNTYGYYSTPIENYLLTSVVKTAYQQYNAATSNITNYVQNTTSFSYLLNSGYNTAYVQTTTTTDSKGQTISKTVYHSGDSGIPLVATNNETGTISAMVSANRLNLPVHEITTRNGVATEVHYSYGIGDATNNNGSANTYLMNRTYYNTIGGTRVQSQQQLLNYNFGTSNLSSSCTYMGSTSSTSAGKYTSVLYDYNYSYPVAKIENASSGSTLQQGTGSFGDIITTGYSTSFTTNTTGTIGFIIHPMGSLGSGTSFSVSYVLSGAASSSGSGCLGSGSGCSSAYQVNLSGMPAGTYSLNISVSAIGGSSASLSLSGSYPKWQSTFTGEFYYEGFEQSGWGSNVTNGGAHTGNAYYNGSGSSYYLPYTIPNNRSYTLQYYALNNGKWQFNEQQYTGPLYLSGAIDDVRVFPSDALMTTYTYNPLVGKTSETDPSGKSVIYQYDGLGLLQTVRDQDNNILRQYEQKYQVDCENETPSTTQNGYFVKNGCPANTYGSTVNYIVPAGKYFDCGQETANVDALNDVIQNGQNYANATGSCSSTAPPCSAPTTITATASNNNITISWNYPPGVTSSAYAIFVVDIAKGTFVRQQYGASSPYTVAGLTAWHQYEVYIQSLCTGYPISSPIIIRTNSNPPPPPPPVYSQSVDYTNLASPPSGFCCYGCQYTTSYYSNTQTIGIGTTLFKDAAMTQPISGVTWIFPLSSNPKTIYAVSGNTVVGNPAPITTCP